MVVLDIEASKKDQEPNYKLIFEMAGEAFMPLGYGGGIKTLDQAKKIFALGIEKVVLNSVLIQNPKLITDIANIYGAQSVVVSLDYKKNLFGKTKPCFYSGKDTLNMDLVSFAQDMINYGAGEIILHDTDRDGTFAGYNLQKLKELSTLSVPLVAMGGCKSLEDMKNAMQNGANALAAGSFFVYRNNDTNAIMINYPSLI